MTATEFQEHLVTFLHRRPFAPFEVSLLNGERFTVDRSDAVSWNAGSAAFIAKDGEVYLFDCTRTQRFNAMPSASVA